MIIDNCLPGRPQFMKKQVIVADEVFDVYFRDVIECIKALFGNPEFSAVLVFQPEQHFTDDSESIRMYHNMHTGEWWWSTQVH
jgi:hypothetical protein